MQSNDTVLFVSPGPDLSNPASGEGARLRNLSRELANQGWDVLALVPEETGQSCPEWFVRQYTYEQWSLPYLTDLNPSFFRTVRHILSSETVDVVHLSTGVCTTKVLTLFDSETTVIHAAQNVEAEHAQDFVDPELPVYKRLLGPRLIPVIEWVTVHCADGVTTVSEKDRERFIERYGLDEEQISAVPTGTTPINPSNLESPDEIRDRLGLGDDPLAVFHGYYNHPPNREAAELIDQKIAPAVREQGGNVEFLLVGKNPPEVSSPNVHTSGFVDDLFSVLNAADTAVVPILHGGGTKTKLYDYVSLNLPIVATEKAVEGVDLEPHRHCLVTNDVDEKFVTSLLILLSGESLYKRLRQSLKQLAAEWRWDQSVSQLIEAYRDSGSTNYTLRSKHRKK
jgi:glycosyltransferase involved in cell wall biosynthesis